MQNAVNTMNRLIELESQVRILGSMYQQRPIAPSSIQQQYLDLDAAGYSLGEQIFDIYASIGAIYRSLNDAG